MGVPSVAVGFGVVLGGQSVYNGQTWSTALFHPLESFLLL